MTETTMMLKRRSRWLTCYWLGRVTSIKIVKSARLMPAPNLPPSQEILKDTIQRIWSLAMWNSVVRKDGWCLVVLVLTQCYSWEVYNNNQASVPKYWGRLWILTRLIRVDHLYSFPPFYSIWSHTLFYFLNWHVLFGLHTIFFGSLNLN